MLTVGETAKALAAVTNQDPQTLARTLRDWLQKDIIAPTDREARGASGTISAALFGLEGVARARILIALASLGGMSGPLKDVDRKLRERGRLRVTAGGSETLSLAAALEGTRKEQKWDLRVTVVRDLLDKDGEEGRLRATADWLRDGESDRPSARDPDAVVFGAVVEAEIIIPFSSLWRALQEIPAVRELEGEGA